MRPAPVAGQGRILIVSPNWIGDAVMAQPLLQLLRAAQPGCMIDVLAPPSVAPVWRRMAEVAQVIETPFRHGALQLGQRWTLARALRRNGYAQAYVLPNTLKFALIPWLAGIARRIGYKGESRYGLINLMHHDEPAAPRPMVAFYAALASAPAPHAPAGLPRPVLAVPPADQAAARAALGLAVTPPAGAVDPDPDPERDVHPDPGLDLDLDPAIPAVPAGRAAGAGLAPRFAAPIGATAATRLGAKQTIADGVAGRLGHGLSTGAPSAVASGLHRDGQRLVVFAPGAEFGAAKRWPAAHFAALAQAILAFDPHCHIVMLGSPKDQPVGAEIIALAAATGTAVDAVGDVRPGLINLAGATTLDQAIALIAGADAVISNDSGLLHIASALNRPVIALYGPTDPDHAPPFSDQARALSLRLDCAPCRQRECPLGHQHCLRQLGAELVWAELRPMLTAR